MITLGGYRQGSYGSHQPILRRAVLSVSLSGLAFYNEYIAARRPNIHTEITRTNTPTARALHRTRPHFHPHPPEPSHPPAHYATFTAPAPSLPPHLHQNADAHADSTGTRTEFRPTRRSRDGSVVLSNRHVHPTEIFVPLPTSPGGAWWDRAPHHFHRHFIVILVVAGGTFIAIRLSNPNHARPERPARTNASPVPGP